MQKQQSYQLRLNDQLWKMIEDIQQHDCVPNDCSFSALIRYIIRQSHQQIDSLSRQSLPLFIPIMDTTKRCIHLYEEDLQRVCDIQTYQTGLKECSMNDKIQRIIQMYWKLIQDKPPQEQEAYLENPNDISPESRQKLSNQIHQIRMNQQMSLSQWGEKYGVSKTGAWHWEHGSRPREKILNRMNQQYNLTHYLGGK